MQSNLREQLATAQATVKTHADNQKMLSTAQARAGNEARRLEAMKKVAVEAAEQAAQVGAAFHMGEATERDVKKANEAAHDAMVAAGGADHAIKRLNREAELISERYHASHPDAVAAQNVCNQIRAAILLESADEAAMTYLEKARAMRDALFELMAHGKALERVQESASFTQHYPQVVQVPSFPGLNAFKPNQQWQMALPVNDVAKLMAAADAVMRKLGTDGKSL